MRKSQAGALSRQALLLFACAFSLAASAQAVGPLPSWNDGTAKRAIVEFVQATTTDGSPQFISLAERIATFDQDGTLWVEQPVYAQVMYCLDHVPAVVKANPVRRPQFAGVSWSYE